MNSTINMKAEHEKVWGECLAIIKDILPSQAFDVWFVPIRPLSIEDKMLTLLLPSSYFYEMLEDRYCDLLFMVLNRVIGTGAKLNYRVMMTNSGDAPTLVDQSGGRRQNAGQGQTVFNPFQGLPSKKIDSQLNHNYTFANFVEGGCNLLARSAGMSIAQQPGKNAFNPMFIYGGSGLGKTHLANAIGLEAERLNPNLNVLYVSANKFQTQYMEATRNNNSTDFLNFYQSLDVLIVDDIQDMASRTGTQNTFFHIFNHLHQAGKQLILTSDQSPNVLQGLDHRILSRFKWGLSAELVPPDFNTKKGILLNKVKAEGLLIPEDVVDYIAGAVTDNVRELEGVVSSLLAQSILINAEINLDLAQKVVGKIANTTTKVVNISKIQEVVCDYYNLEVNDIQTKSRKRVVVQARQVAMYLARKYTKNSLTAIGELIGNRDHATVLHACKTVAEQSEIDKELKQSLDSIEEKLR